MGFLREKSLSLKHYFSFNIFYLKNDKFFFFEAALLECCALPQHVLIIDPHFVKTGGADSAPRYNSMKEGTEILHCYLEFGRLSKWRSHAKIWVPISKIERDFKIFKKS